jgi:rod shape-determining protein MreB
MHQPPAGRLDRLRAAGRHFVHPFLKPFATDLAIDLGTANTLVFVRGKGVVSNEPSVVAVDVADSRLIAVGAEAKRMLGRTPRSIAAIRPLHDGVIAHFSTAEAMLRHAIRSAQPNTSLVGPRVLMAVPSGITEVERRAVRESAISAGAREVYMIEEAMAAAIGAGLPVDEPTGHLIVDIGGGTTQVAVISMAGVVVANSIRVGGNRMDAAIVQYLKRKRNLLIGEPTAEQIKLEIGSALPPDHARPMVVKGRDLVAGVPKAIQVTSADAYECLAEPVGAIVEAVRGVLERTPPELASDITETGIVLTGGGALLRDLDGLLERETGLPAMRADDPLRSVIHGCGRCLDQLALFRRVAHG